MKVSEPLGNVQMVVLAFGSLKEDLYAYMII